MVIAVALFYINAQNMFSPVLKIEVEFDAAVPYYFYRRYCTMSSQKARLGLFQVEVWSALGGSSPMALALSVVLGVPCPRVCIALSLLR